MYILGKLLSVLVSLGLPHLWVIDARLITAAPPLPRWLSYVNEELQNEGAAQAAQTWLPVTPSTPKASLRKTT